MSNPNGLIPHHACPCSSTCVRTSPMPRSDAAPRSIGAVPPDAAAAQLASRNSSLVATRSWARVRTRSGSSTSTWLSGGSSSTSSSISSTSAGESDSIPSTAIPCASLSVISTSCGCALPSSAARRRTSSVSSSSRHGGAQTRSTGSRVRWSATANARISSISSPKNSTRKGCSSVGGKTSTMPPRTANSPRFSTRSTREYAAPASRLTTSSSSTSCPRDSSTGSRSASPLTCGCSTERTGATITLSGPLFASSPGCLIRRSTASRRPTVSLRGLSRSCGSVSQAG